VTSCVVRTVQKCGFAWGSNKGKRTKTIYLNIIYKIALQCNCNCNSFLSHQVFHIDMHAFRSLLCVVYALCKALAVRTRNCRLLYHGYNAVTDDSWRKCRPLDHGYNAVAWLLGRQPCCAQDSHWLLTEEVEKGQILCVHTYPTTSFRQRGRRVQSSAEIGSEMWICIRYKQTKTNKKPFQIYILDYILYYMIW
jgi:hypothetical protein